VGLDYKFDDTLLYGKISRGYKAGGFSATAPSPELYIFDPEHVLNYELGQKSDFSIGAMPARVNTSIYFTEFDDMQRGGIDRGANGFGAGIYTAGGAEIFGFEMDATIEPLPDLRISLNYAYTDARYTNFSFINTGFTAQRDCSGQQIQPGSLLDINCAPVQYTPKNQASTTISYDLPLPTDVGQVSTSITYSWTDDIYAGANSIPEAEPGGWIDSVGLLNASVSWWSIFQSNFDFMIYGTNLTDEEYRVSNSNVWNLAYYRSSIYGEPRMYGARLSYSYN
jgi:iron complex outermembrane receptor protein